ncbi:hypothetical protein [Methylorubrum aminovorans]|uniref:hypothetical protein n=1 Tax=Methylorubrum aminovorans TaxID=269069 RepID=UPI003C30640C
MHTINTSSHYQFLVFWARDVSALHTEDLEMLPEVVIGNKAIVSSGAFFLHATERSATILLSDASFTIHVFDPNRGESAPTFNLDANMGAQAAMPGSFYLMQFGPNAKYDIRFKVNHAFEGGNEVYLLQYSVHEH